jgi:uncharacterized protein (TIGR00369 family)
VTEVSFPTVFSPEETLDGVLGLEIDEQTDPGVISARLPYAPRICQPMGIVHGGVYAAIGESLASRGTAFTVVAQGKRPLGQSNNTSFMRPVSGGTIHARGVAVHRGRTSWIWDVEMRDDDGRLCAASRVTIAVR